MLDSRQRDRGGIRQPQASPTSPPAKSRVVPMSDNTPTFGLNGAELALWRCWAATGADISQGPYRDWHQDAVEDVAQQRQDHDRLQAALDDLIDTAERVRVDLKEIL